MRSRCSVALVGAMLAWTGGRGGGGWGYGHGTAVYRSGTGQVVIDSAIPGGWSSSGGGLPGGTVLCVPPAPKAVDQERFLLGVKHAIVPTPDNIPPDRVCVRLP
jgi:hypothetical protein